MLQRFALLILPFLAPAVFALPCDEYLTTQKVPWIQPVILSAPAVYAGEVIGKVAIWRDQVVAARPCKWCPQFTSVDEANAYFEQNPLGTKTVMAAASLLRMSRRGFADTFYGFALSGRTLHFITKIPSGLPLRQLIESRGPWLFSDAGNYFPGARRFSIRSVGVIPSQSVKAAVKLRDVLNEPSSLFPFAYIVYAKPRAFENSLLDFLNSIEWSVSANGSMKLSFYNLDKIFASDGSLRPPLIESNGERGGMGYARILLASMTLLSNDIGRSYLSLMDAKTVDFFWLPYMLTELRTHGTFGDPLLKKVQESSRNVNLARLDRLIHMYDNGEMRFTPQAAFATHELLLQHFAKHGNSFGANSAEGYLSMARRFLAGENVAAECGKTSQNRRVLYQRISLTPSEYVILDPDSRITAVVNVDGVLKTFFIQSEASSGMDPEQYLVDQARKDLTGYWRIETRF